ncbi:MAG TPA: hypothetical protein VFO16_24135 [Pseudonocardiaceae bacterium]|nr:hypothetical protein [Pseudonocardiaceae bacterium]
MSVGLPVHKSDIDSRAGSICSVLQMQFQAVLSFQGYLDATANADLIAMGYTDQEVATLKTAFADLFLLAQIYTGAVALPAAKDFRTFARQLWGVGP